MEGSKLDKIWHTNSYESKDAKKNITDLTKGCWNSHPIIGIFCRNTARVGQKPLQQIKLNKPLALGWKINNTSL